jgi:hypothetical protein
MKTTENNLWLTHLIDEEIYLINNPISEINNSLKIESTLEPIITVKKDINPEVPQIIIVETQQKNISKEKDSKVESTTQTQKITPLPSFEKLEANTVQKPKVEPKIEKIGFVFFYENENTAPTQVLDVIQKSMSSLNILSSNYEILNLANQLSKLITIDCEKILVAGAEKHLAQLKFSKPVKILITDSIDSYLSDRNSKMIIWNKMKEFFS